MNSDFIQKLKGLYVFTPILLLLGIVVLEGVEAWIEANSTDKIIHCGLVNKIYEKVEGRGKNTYFDMEIQGKVQPFSLINGNLKAWFNPDARMSKARANLLKVGDNICITYSPKYMEGSFWTAGQKEVPYVFKLEKQ